MKTCFKCGTPKNLDEFYAHPRMADGHLNKCKSCTKEDVQRRYEAKRALVAAYERGRSADPGRKARSAQYQRNQRERSPEKWRARRIVAYHIRVGNLSKRPCAYCGGVDAVEAHHDDYSKPLDVRWVCFWCHREREHGQVCVSRPGSS